MESKMKLWECKYKIFDGFKDYYVKDWIWSTTQPTNLSIGHYWKHLFNYPVSEQSVRPAPQGVDCSCYKLSDVPF